jgi:hypothetical protein
MAPGSPGRREGLVLGLGWPEWITIISLVGALVLTVWLMGKASVAYDKARRAREAAEEGKEEG